LGALVDLQRGHWPFGAKIAFLTVLPNRFAFRNSCSYHLSLLGRAYIHPYTPPHRSDKPPLPSFAFGKRFRNLVRKTLFQHFIHFACPSPATYRTQNLTPGSCSAPFQTPRDAVDKPYVERFDRRKLICKDTHFAPIHITFIPIAIAVIDNVVFYPLIPQTQ